jgi:PBP1b-binding outer membrane lipoprotein LpoB
MKKVLAIALIASAMVACNNKGDKKEEVKDSTVVAPVDTTTPAPVDTTAPAVVDTTAPAK